MGRLLWKTLTFTFFFNNSFVWQKSHPDYFESLDLVLALYTEQFTLQSNLAYKGKDTVNINNVTGGRGYGTHAFYNNRKLCMHNTHMQTMCCVLKKWKSLVSLKGTGSRFSMCLLIKLCFSNLLLIL